jgi:hypothetical protein
LVRVGTHHVGPIAVDGLLPTVDGGAVEAEHGGRTHRIFIQRPGGTQPPSGLYCRRDQVAEAGSPTMVLITRPETRTRLTNCL